MRSAPRTDRRCRLLTRRAVSDGVTGACCRVTSARPCCAPSAAGCCSSYPVRFVVFLSVSSGATSSVRWSAAQNFISKRCLAEECAIFCVPTESSEFPENDVIFCCALRMSYFPYQSHGCRMQVTPSADNTLSWALFAYLENASQKLHR